MSMKIILLIIALQVVFGLLAKRKAKQAAEAAAREGEKGAPQPGSGATAPHPQRRIPESPENRRSYDEDEADEQDEWDEHPLRGQTRTPQSRESRESREYRDPRDLQTSRDLPGSGDRRNPGDGRPGKAKELGKDILSQLAKELGLEFPSPPERKPGPAPKPPPAPTTAKAPAHASGPSKTSAPKTATAVRAIDRAKRALDTARIPETHTHRPTNREGGEATGRRIPGNSSATPYSQPDPVRSASELARESLYETESIRRAFILKTILDKPLSLQPRRPGEN